VTTSPIPGATPIAEPAATSQFDHAAHAMTLPVVQTTIPEEEPASVRLRLVTGYFQIAAGLSVLRILSFAFIAMGSDASARAYRELPLQFMFGLILSAIGLMWTARALRNRSRMAWIPAMLALATPLIPALMGVPLSTFSLVTAVAGLLVLFSVRKELD
jgi:hypothetical protein